jgi:hypothetical protein
MEAHEPGRKRNHVDSLGKCGLLRLSISCVRSSSDSGDVFEFVLSLVEQPALREGSVSASVATASSGRKLARRWPRRSSAAGALFTLQPDCQPPRLCGRSEHRPTSGRLRSLADEQVRANRLTKPQSLTSFSTRASGPLAESADATFMLVCHKVLYPTSYVHMLCALLLQR